jgi:hypothetical protein
MTATAPAVLTVTDRGDADLHVSSIAMTDGDAAEFDSLTLDAPRADGRRRTWACGHAPRREIAADA